MNKPMMKGISTAIATFAFVVALTACSASLTQ
jgi:hypothetical protein